MEQYWGNIYRLNRKNYSPATVNWVKHSNTYRKLTSWNLYLYSIKHKI